MILVFGQSGQVAVELARQGADLCLSRTQADFETPGALRAALAQYRPDAVINAAAYTAVDKAETERKRAFQVNAHAVGELAQACAAAKIPLVHLSSDYVFDGSGDTPWQPEDQTGPINVYGQSKLAGEDAVRAAGGVHAILRTSWVVSAYGANFVKTMLRLGGERDALSVVGDQIGAPTCAHDIAAACLQIAKQLRDEAGKTGTYHYQSRPEASWAEVAREVFVQSGLMCRVADITTDQYPTPARRPFNSRLDCRRTEDVFGLPAPHWHAGLAQILQTIE